MTKLSDIQAVLLSGASQRPNGSLLPLPASVAGGTRLAKPIAGLLTRGLAEERATGVAEEVHRTDGDLRLGLFITAAGEAAIGVEDDDRAGAPEPDLVPGGDPSPAPAPAPAPASAAPVPAVPRQTKAALVLGLLTRDHGATLSELVAATGWLAHTTRAALTGLRRNGHDVQRGKRDGVTFYRVPTIAAAEAR